MFVLDTPFERKRIEEEAAHRIRMKEITAQQIEHDLSSGKYDQTLLDDVQGELVRDDPLVRQAIVRRLHSVIWRGQYDEHLPELLTCSCQEVREYAKERVLFLELKKGSSHGRF